MNAVTAVTSIEQSARAGLAELNTLVRQLRQASPADPRPGLQPRLDDVPGLVARARQAGLRAELRVDGETRPLADAIELAGYRMVQEGLTNAVRYAPGAAATVRLRYSGTGITIEVADEGRAGPDGGSIPVGGGAGLAGLRERAAMLGGQFEAGSGQQGFVIRAFLPSPA